MPMHTQHDQALRIARESVVHYPAYEPSAWLRAAALAATLGVVDGCVPGVNYIVPLVPGKGSGSAVHLCSRCGASSPARCSGFRTCGFAATWGEISLKFAFELCQRCADREYGGGSDDLS